MTKDEYLDIVNNFTKDKINILLSSYADDNNKDLSSDALNDFKRTGIINQAIEVAMKYYEDKFIITTLKTKNGILKW